jgi:hypothetical protein
MTETEGITLESFRVLTERSGLDLTEAELAALKPMFDFYAERLQKLHEVELDAEDLAVVFAPGWNPQG